jgi:hypothetical protein
MPGHSRVGAGHLAALIHRALERGDAAALAALRAECARRPAADQEACRREWVRQGALRRRGARWRAGMPGLHGPRPGRKPPCRGGPEGSRARE